MTLVSLNHFRFQAKLLKTSYPKDFEPFYQELRSKGLTEEQIKTLIVELEEPDLACDYSFNILGGAVSRR